MAMSPQEAREILRRCHVPIDAADFHMLNTSQVQALLVEADMQRYRKPRNANGSRGRYFYAMLQRRAAKAQP
jgi:hypothetical protein